MGLLANPVQTSACVHEWFLSTTLGGSVLAQVQCPDFFLVTDKKLCSDQCSYLRTGLCSGQLPVYMFVFFVLFVCFFFCPPGWVVRLLLGRSKILLRCICLNSLLVFIV